MAHLTRVDPVIARLIDAQPDHDPRAWLAQLPPMDLFGALVFQVAGQQLSVAASRRILDRLRAQFGGANPTPEALVAASDEALRSTGMSRRKIATLRDLAARFSSGELDEVELARLPDDEVEARLTTIGGIGPWTVHGALIIALDRQDVVLPGDLALRKAISAAYGLDHLPDPDEVLAIAEPWRPYRSLATSYLFASNVDRAT